MTRTTRTTLSLAAALLAVGCENAGTGLGISLFPSGTVGVFAYLDRDGSRTYTPALDTVFANARVALLPVGGTDTARVITTGPTGQAVFSDVPLGRYRVVIDPASIGDTISVQLVDSAAGFTVAANDSIGVLARLGYPEVSIRAVRGLPLGRRVFLRAVVLAGVQSFRDTTSHITDTSGFLRLTRVNLRGGLTGNNPGDSVSVLGVTATRLGLPVLDNVSLARFGVRPAPVPIAVSTGSAATATNGTLDAALVQVTGAIISDTSTVAPDFLVRGSDGSGDLEILLDGNINFFRANFRIGRSMNARGVLVPDGLGRWRLKPRDTGDVIFNN